MFLRGEDRLPRDARNPPYRLGSGVSESLCSEAQGTPLPQRGQVHSRLDVPRSPAKQVALDREGPLLETSHYLTQDLASPQKSHWTYPPDGDAWEWGPWG